MSRAPTRAVSSFGTATRLVAAAASGLAEWASEAALSAVAMCSGEGKPLAAADDDDDDDEAGVVVPLVVALEWPLGGPAAVRPGDPSAVERAPAPAPAPPPPLSVTSALPPSPPPPLSVTSAPEAAPALGPGVMPAPAAAPRSAPRPPPLVTAERFGCIDAARNRPAVAGGRRDADLTATLSAATCRDTLSLDGSARPSGRVYEPEAGVSVETTSVSMALRDAWSLLPVTGGARGRVTRGAAGPAAAASARAVVSGRAAEPPAAPATSAGAPLPPAA